MGIQINGNTNNINAGIGSLSIEDLNELDIIGVATASNFKTGVSNLHNVGLTLSGGQIDVGSNIKLGNAGVITATSFSGDGSQLTGTVSLTNGSNDRVVTATGAAGLNGESTLSFNTSNGLVCDSGTIRCNGGFSSDVDLILNADHNNNGTGSIIFKESGNEKGRIDHSGNLTATGTIETTGSELKITGTEPRLTFTDTDNNPDFQIWANAQRLSIYDSTNSATRIRIDSSGNVGMNTTVNDSTGNCRSYVFARTDANGQVRIIMKNQGTGFGNGAGYHQGIDGSNVFIENRSNGGAIDIATISSNTYASRLRISPEGYVNKPYHPAFAARLGSNIDLTSNTFTDIVFSVQEFDNSGSYNTSNGRFTVPVAGKYYFGVQIYAGFNGTGVRVLHAHFRVNGTSVAQTDMFGGASNHGGTHYHPTAVGHAFLSLNKNDYVTWNTGGFSHTGGQAILYASTGNRFFGYLIT